MLLGGAFRKIVNVAWLGCDVLIDPGRASLAGQRMPIDRRGTGEDETRNAVSQRQIDEPRRAFRIDLPELRFSDPADMRCVE